jgi:hypothetical protein
MMGHPRVIVSAASRERLAYARRWIATQRPADENPGRRCQRRCRERGAAHRGCTSGSSVWLAPTELPPACRHAGSPLLAERGLVPLSSRSIEVVVTRLVHDLRQQGDLGRFSGVATAPGFPRAIAAVMSEVRLAVLDHDHINAVDRDLASLMTAYEKNLAKWCFADWPTTLSAATETVIKGLAGHQLVGLLSLFLDVPLRS